MNSTDEAKAILRDDMEQGDCRQVDECRCADCFQYAREIIARYRYTSIIKKPRRTRIELSWENGFRD